MAWGADRISNLCEHTMHSLNGQGVFLLVRDDATDKTNWGVAALNRGFLPLLPRILEVLAHDVLALQERVLASSTPAIVKIESKYDEVSAALLHSLKVGGLVLIVFRGDKGTGGSVAGLWTGTSLANVLRDAAAKIEKNLKAS